MKFRQNLNFVGHSSSKFGPNFDGKWWQNFHLSSFSQYIYRVLKATSHISVTSHHFYFNSVWNEIFFMIDKVLCFLIHFVVALMTVQWPCVTSSSMMGNSLWKKFFFTIRWMQPNVKFYGNFDEKQWPRGLGLSDTRKWKKWSILLHILFFLSCIIFIAGCRKFSLCLAVTADCFKSEGKFDCLFWVFCHGFFE